MLPTTVIIGQEPRSGIDQEIIKKVRNNSPWQLLLGIALIIIDGVVVTLVNNNQATGSSYSLTYSGVWGGAVCVAAAAIAMAVVNSRSPDQNLIAISALISTSAGLLSIAVMVLQGLAASSCVPESCSTNIANLHVAGTGLSTVLFIFSLDGIDNGCKIYGKSAGGGGVNNIEPAVVVADGTTLPGAIPPYPSGSIIGQNPPTYFPPTR